MTEGSAGCIHHGRAGGAAEALATKRQRIGERIRAGFAERGEGIPSEETMTNLVGLAMTEAARAKSADPIRVSKISRAVQERQRLERLDGTIDQWSSDRELDKAVAFLKKFAVAHPGLDGALARDYLERFEKALNRGLRATTVLEAFKSDREVYGRVYKEGLSGHGHRANTGAHRRASLKQSLAVWWRFATGGKKKAPRLRDLVDPPAEGRGGAKGARKAKIPAEFQTWNQVVNLFAVVHILVSKGQDEVDVGQRFGWPVEEGRRCRMADGFVKVGLKLSASKRYAPTWREALRAAKESLGV